MIKLISAVMLLGLLGVLPGCHRSASSGEPQFRVQTFRTGSGWGYAIFVNGREYIRQRCIPAIEGDIAFRSSQDALRTGNYVVRKLQHNAPPSLTRKELVRLHLIEPSSARILKEHP